MTDIRQKLDEILRSVVQDPSMIPENMDELDSIDLMELSMAIELHFGVSLTGVEISDLGNLNALGKAIQAQSAN
jgi:acyl carrier protein